MDMETTKIRISKQRYTRKRKCHGKRKSINDDTVVQVEDQGAHSSINSAPELVEDGATAVYCDATTTALLKFWTLVLNLIQIYYPGYRLMDVNILDGIFNCLTCPECYEVETLHLNDTNTKKKGPARLIQKCNDSEQKGGGKFMEVNLRAVVVCKLLG